MTKSTLRTLVQQAVGNRSSVTVNAAWFDTRVLNAYKQLVTFQGMVFKPGRKVPQYRILRFPNLENRITRTLDTSISTNFVANQATVEMVDDIFDRTNNRGMERKSERRIRQLDPDEAGIPRIWEPASEGGLNGYYIWPSPGVASDNIDVYEYVVLTPVLATDSTEPLVPAEWHPAIVLLASAEAAEQFDMPERAAEIRQTFTTLVASLQAPNEIRSAAGLAGTRRRIRVGLR